VKYRYSNGVISSEEVLKFLSLIGMANSIVSEAIKRKEIIKKASELGLTVGDDQLQRFADNFRMARGLRSADETVEFLDTWGLSEEDFEAFCESSVMAELLVEFLATNVKIQDYFANNRAEFDLARVSGISVEKESLANELVMQIRDDGQDFHALARTHSVDEATKYAGGYMGMVSRSAFDPDMAAKVFNASPGDVIGPFRCGELFRILLVEEIIRADLKREDVRSAVKDAILAMWTSQFLKEGVRVE
jgi:parvulin-like peptidyl-prolyl isomerase